MPLYDPAAPPLSINMFGNQNKEKRWLVIQDFIHLVEVLKILSHLMFFFIPLSHLKKINRVRLLAAFYIWVPRKI